MIRALPGITAMDVELVVSIMRLLRTTAIPFVFRVWGSGE